MFQSSPESHSSAYRRDSCSVYIRIRIILILCASVWLAFISLVLHAWAVACLTCSFPFPTAHELLTCTRCLMSLSEKAILVCCVLSSCTIISSHIMVTFQQMMATKLQVKLITQMLESISFSWHNSKMYLFLKGQMLSRERSKNL